MVEITENLKAVFGTIRLVLHGLLEALLDVMPEQVVPDAVGTHHNDVVLLDGVLGAERLLTVIVDIQVAVNSELIGEIEAVLLVLGGEQSLESLGLILASSDDHVAAVAVVGCAKSVRVVLVEGSDHQGAR
eukprot:CAMPEP_0168618898 /NCGR_PEP_ID=MMETSP0449_2-20121227/6315_1 /TAXON_ID=1082188 /ORGANISM="Strombidium rassoulzadegani, Strain ras09" /LENGTH=130 /DNA_ID=CAMNT_0008659799 /DNA_START=311 /DNA_END=700 /DNA_ORIENTATION=+